MMARCLPQVRRRDARTPDGRPACSIAAAGIALFVWLVWRVGTERDLDRLPPDRMGARADRACSAACGSPRAPARGRSPRAAAPAALRRRLRRRRLRRRARQRDAARARSSASRPRSRACAAACRSARRSRRWRSRTSLYTLSVAAMIAAGTIALLFSVDASAVRCGSSARPRSPRSSLLFAASAVGAVAAAGRPEPAGCPRRRPDASARLRATRTARARSSRRSTRSRARRRPRSPPIVALELGVPRARRRRGVRHAVADSRHAAGAARRPSSSRRRIG